MLEGMNGVCKAWDSFCEACYFLNCLSFELEFLLRSTHLNFILWVQVIQRVVATDPRGSPFIYGHSQMVF